MIGLFYLFLIFVVYQKILNWLNEISQGYEKKDNDNNTKRQ